MTVKHLLYPEEGIFAGSAFPQLIKLSGSNFPFFGLAFDASSDEAAFWKLKAQNYGSGNLALYIMWYADNATSGNVVWEAQIAAITPDSDSQDVETKSFAALSYVQDAHLGSVGQRVHGCTITISNLDSLAADDIFFLRLARDANSSNATDDMDNDAILILAELSYSDT